MLSPEDEEMAEMSIVKDNTVAPSGGEKVKHFDPDEDGFEFGFDQASALHKNINILQYIRKVLMPNSFR